jgi:hypothetical protein
VSKVVPRACQAKRRSTASKNATRSSGVFMRRTDGRSTVFRFPRSYYTVDEGIYLYIPSRGIRPRFRNRFSIYKKMKRLGID